MVACQGISCPSSFLPTISFSDSLVDEPYEESLGLLFPVLLPFTQHFINLLIPWLIYILLSECGQTTRFRWYPVQLSPLWSPSSFCFPDLVGTPNYQTRRTRKPEKLPFNFSKSFTYKSPETTTTGWLDSLLESKNTANGPPIWIPTVWSH